MADTGNDPRDLSLRPEHPPAAEEQHSAEEPFDSPGDAGEVQRDADDDAAAGAPDEDTQQQPSPPPPPPFQPLFTLLTNSTTNATAHPRVRYLFADDDDASTVLSQARADPATRAILVDLAPAANPPPPPSSSTTTSASQPKEASNSSSNWSISWASSLKPDFAVTDSSLVPQRSEGDSHRHASTTAGGAREGEEAPALMLSIEGVEREPVDLAPDSTGGGSGSGTAENVDGLVDDFQRRMAVLGKVVAEGEKRRDVVRREEERRGSSGEQQGEQGEEAQEDHEEEAAVEGAGEVSRGRGA